MAEYDKMAQKAIDIQTERMERLKGQDVIEHYEIQGVETREPGLYNVDTVVRFKNGLLDENVFFAVQFDVGDINI